MHHDDVLGLDVPMQKLVIVQIAHCVQHGINDEGRGLLAVGFFALELRVEVPVGRQLQQYVHVVSILEETVKVDDVLMSHEGVEFQLANQLCYQLFLGNLLLLDDLQSRQEACLLVPHHKHGAKLSLPEKLQFLEVIDAQLAFLRRWHTVSGEPSGLGSRKRLVAALMHKLQSRQR